MTGDPRRGRDGADLDLAGARQLGAPTPEAVTQPPGPVTTTGLAPPRSHQIPGRGLTADALGLTITVPTTNTSGNSCKVPPC